MYERLVALVRDGNLAPGDPIRDRDLAVQLGVSRTPVREAIQRLERLGLVDVWPGRQAKVRLLSSDDVKSLHHYFAEVCAVHLRLYLGYDQPSEDLAEIHRGLLALADVAEADWAEAFVSVMDQVRRAESPARGRMLANQLPLLSMILRRSLTPPRNRRQLCLQLAEAVGNRDGAAAALLVRELLGVGVLEP